MFKRIFFWGLTSGIMAASAAIIFKRIHEFATYTDFSAVVSIPLLIALNLGICLIAALLYWGSTKWLPQRGEVFFNLLFSLLSFASITYSLAVTLPLEIKFPELFPCLTVPMHFFPALAWFTARPLFVKDAVVLK
jgi:hypothetical protein